MRRVGIGAKLTQAQANYVAGLTALRKNAAQEAPEGDAPHSVARPRRGAAPRALRAADRQGFEGLPEDRRTGKSMA